MKLSTALLERADLQRRISELATRLNNNAKVQEGEEPAENPTELLTELDGIFVQLEALIARINHTNDVTKVNDLSLTDLLARRDCLKQRMKIMRDFLDSASDRATRYSKTEIRIVSTVSVSELQKEADALAKEWRIIDEKIQALNWTTELV